MALRLSEIEPRSYDYVCTPTGWELPPMQAHWDRLGVILGQPLKYISGQGMDELVQIQQALPNFRMRWCTRKIKIVPFERFIRASAPCTVYVGIRADETGDREGVDYERIAGVERRFPMDEWGWTLSDVLSYLQSKNIEIPERTDCDACFFQTLYEWWLFWNQYPERWHARESLEAQTGHTLRSNERDSWPASMKGLRLRFEAGEVPKDRRNIRHAMCAVCAR